MACLSLDRNEMGGGRLGGSTSHARLELVAKIQKEATAGHSPIGSGLWNATGRACTTRATEKAKGAQGSRRGRLGYCSLLLRMA